MTLTRAERIEGCLLGLALGDALGAPLEGGVVERAVWTLLCLPSRGALRWTDDTQMALGLCESVAERGRLDQDDLARRWAAEARWSRGYGPGTWKVLKRIRSGEDWRAARTKDLPEGSWGNGAAMRVAPLGAAGLQEEAARSAEVTHAHPLGVEGAVLIARAAAIACRDRFDERGFLGEIRSGASAPFRAQLDAAAPLLTGTPALESVPTALRCFAEQPRDFDALMARIARLGGDVDTIGAMAGALYGALNGSAALPAALVARLEQAYRLKAAAARLAAL